MLSSPAQGGDIQNSKIIVSRFIVCFSPLSRTRSHPHLHHITHHTSLHTARLQCLQVLPQNSRHNRVVGISCRTRCPNSTCIDHSQQNATEDATEEAGADTDGVALLEEEVFGSWVGKFELWRYEEG